MEFRAWANVGNIESDRTKYPEWNTKMKKYYAPFLFTFKISPHSKEVYLKEDVENGDKPNKESD